MTPENSPTALDKLMGYSPHLAASTDFGLFCPACSDPLKLSFVPASSCRIAEESASRTEESALIDELMLQAGLRRLSGSARSKAVEEHQITFKRAQRRWKDRHTDSH